MAIDGLSLLLPSPPSCATEFPGPIVLCGVGVGLENHLPISSGKMPLKKNSLALETFCSQKSLSGKVLSINRALSVQMTKSMYSRTGEQRSCNWAYGKLGMTKVTTSWLKTFQFVTVPKTCWVFKNKVLGKKKKKKKNLASIHLTKK